MRIDPDFPARKSCARKLFCSSYTMQVSHTALSIWVSTCNDATPSGIVMTYLLFRYFPDWSLITCCFSSSSSIRYSLQLIHSRHLKLFEQLLLLFSMLLPPVYFLFRLGLLQWTAHLIFSHQ